MNRLKPNRTRKHAHIIYLSDEEEAAVKLRMKKAKMKSFSKYARHCLTEVYFLIIDDSKELREFTAEINKIGVNINQIAHALNAGQIVPEKEIVLIKDWMATIWDFQRCLYVGEAYTGKRY